LHDMDYIAGLYTDFLASRSVFHAFVLVDGYHTIHLRDRIGRAFPDAGPTMNTPVLADGSRDFTAILGAAPDQYPGVPGDQADNPFRAGLDTYAAAYTEIFRDNREIVHHGDRVKGTSFGTFPKSNAAVLALHGTGKGQIRSRARPIADIVIFFVYVSLDPGAVDSGYEVLDGAWFLSRNFSHGISHFLFARKTEIWWNIWFGHHSFGVCFTPGEAAPASLRPGQGLLHLFNLGINFHRKFMGGQGKPNTKEQADNAEDGQATKG